MLIRVAEPHPILAGRVAATLREQGHEPITELHEIDSSDYIHDESDLLDASELADAKAALIEDGIFAPREWTEADLRAATKYGWAIAHAALNTRPGINVWSVAEGGTATTEHELRFIAAELRRRAIAVTHIAPCWPVAIEPALDLGELSDAFIRALARYESAGVGLFIPNAAGKSIVAGPDALLDFANIGWLEAARSLAVADAALFRRVLACAQEHFAFDKPRAGISTSEDDIHALPDVPDADLERTFLDDFRGRQLLHVTARSIFADEALCGPLAAFLAAG
ncbi:MAG: tagaturonate epimerase family protein [Chthoniobacteraceae bacterium]